MDRSTATALADLAAEGLTTEERIARARAGAKQPHATLRDIVQLSLPSGTLVPVVTLTADELHDLVYAAVGNVLRRNTSMTKTTTQTHAARSAIEAHQLAYGLGYIERGVDPRG